MDVVTLIVKWIGTGLPAESITVRIDIGTYSYSAVTDGDGSVRAHIVPGHGTVTVNNVRRYTGPIAGTIVVWV